MYHSYKCMYEHLASGMNLNVKINVSCLRLQI